MPKNSTLRNRAFDVDLIAEETLPVFTSPFSIINATLRFSLFDGGLCNPVNWVKFERGDGAAVLLFDEEEDAVVLVRQFRYPVFSRIVRDDPAAQDFSRAWVFEVIAGSVAEGETHLDVARQELLEEAGYDVDGDLEPISTFYVSPGGTSEKIILFLGRVGGKDRTKSGGGVGESEDIEVVNLPLDEAFAMVESGDIFDAKTIIALHWLTRRLGR